jgi:hypothetical protein
MATWFTVNTQVELNAAIADRKTHIEINASAVLELRVPDSFVPAIRSVTHRLVKLLAGRVVARGSSRVVALGSSRVEARESSSVEAWGSSRVVARESSSVVALESSRVVARGSSRVVALGSSSVVALESSRVEARESSSVEAWGSSSVEARESSSVVARGAVALRVIGPSVTATAATMCAVHIEQSGRCAGGTQIVVPAISHIEQWCEFYGVDIVDGVVVLFKGVDDEFRSPRGGIYIPGTTPAACDWDGGEKECGGGFHFSPVALMTLEFASNATRFVACPIRVSDIRHPKPGDSHPSKVKARGCCAPCYEVDRFGQEIATKSTTPVS